jgi:hypothetical protein
MIVTMLTQRRRTDRASRRARANHPTVVLSAFALAVVAAGCGSEGVSKSGAKHPTPLLTPAQLRGALLRVEDLPSGWKRAGEDNVSSLCPGGPRPVAGVETLLEKGPLGPTILHVALRLRRGAGPRAMAAMRRAPTCLFFGSDESDIDSVSPVSFPKLAEDSFAVRVRGATSGFPAFPFSAVVAILRDGDILLLVVESRLKGSVDTNEVESLARRALERLQEESAHAG